MPVTVAPVILHLRECSCEDQDLSFWPKTVSKYRCRSPTSGGYFLENTAVDNIRPCGELHESWPLLSHGNPSYVPRKGKRWTLSIILSFILITTFRRLVSVSIFRWNLLIWAQWSKFHQKTETESSLRNVPFKMKERVMNNVQNCDSYINRQSSRTCR
jgi:hypothetical protein